MLDHENNGWRKNEIAGLSRAVDKGHIAGVDSWLSKM